MKITLFVGSFLIFKRMKKSILALMILLSTFSCKKIEETVSSIVVESKEKAQQKAGEYEKVDGTVIVEKITFFEKFLPPNSIDTSFLDDIKNDKNIEYYKVKRFPNASTIIYNPKSGMVYHFVEVKK